MPRVNNLPRIGFMGFVSLGCTTELALTARSVIERPMNSPRYSRSDNRTNYDGKTLILNGSADGGTSTPLEPDTAESIRESIQHFIDGDMDEFDGSPVEYSMWRL